MAGEKDYLQALLAGESRAYGFTIAFWGSGALLINGFGVPNFIEAMSYGLGAVTGFGLLALIAFRSTLATVENSDSTTVVLSMVHYLAALIPVIIASLIVENIENSVTAFFLAGGSVSLIYNMLSVLEEDIAELLS